MACPGVALLNHHKKPQIETTNLNKNRRRLYVVLYGKCCILISIRDVWMWTNRSLFEEAVHWTDNSKDYSRAVSWYQLGFRALSTKVNSLNLISTGSIKVMKMHVWKLLNPLRLMPWSPFTFWIRDHMDQSETRKGWANVESDGEQWRGRKRSWVIHWVSVWSRAPWTAVWCMMHHWWTITNKQKKELRGPKVLSNINKEITLLK